MGMYLNPGSAAFLEALNSEIYVDKTGLIAETNALIGTKQKYVCVSRPRRFGKTTALDMLAAYYDRTQDAREVFAGYEIAASESFETHRNRYDVLQINMIHFFTGKKEVGEALAVLEKTILREIRREYECLDNETEWTLASCMNEIFAVHQRRFIVIIDEWDCIFREYPQDKEGQTLYLDYLRNWMKDKSCIALAYMTGILPIKKYGKHSALNMFDEYAMTGAFQFARFTGFTGEEVEGFSKKYNMSFTAFQAWYDGYLLQDTIPPGEREKYARGEYQPKTWHIYSPLSVVRALRTGYVQNYWNKTETFEALKVYIEMNFDGLRDAVIELIAGGRRKVETESFQNDMTTFVTADDVLTLLVHIGYLGYDSLTEEVFIPNKEVSDEFVNATRTGNWEEIRRAISASEKLLADTLAGDADAVSAAIENAHLETSHLQYNDENALSYTIALAYYSAKQYYRTVRELPSGKGFADMVFLPLPRFAESHPAMVVELKWDDTADTAIRQIKNKQYTKALEGYAGKIRLVGIGYDKQTRKHSCVIEEG